MVDLLQTCKEMLSALIPEPSAAPAEIRRVLVAAFAVGDPHDPAYDVYLHSAQLALEVEATAMPQHGWMSSFDSDRTTTVEVLDAMVLMAAGAMSLTMSQLEVAHRTGEGSAHRSP